MKTIISAANPVGRVSRSLAPVLAVCTLGFLAGCASEPESHLVSAPPPPPPSSQPAVVYSTPTPVYSTPTPVYTTAPSATVYTNSAGQTIAIPSPVGASSIVVMQAPPAAQQEVPSARPTRDHVWVAGYWSWTNNRYEWRAGHWEIPARAGAVWVPPRWQPEGVSWRFYEGYWE